MYTCFCMEAPQPPDKLLIKLVRLGDQYSGGRLYYVTLHYSISYYVMLHYITLYHIILYNNIIYYITLYHIIYQAVVCVPS